MKNSEMTQLQQALGELINEKLPIATALKIRKIIRELTPHLEDMEAEKRKIINSYVPLDETGAPSNKNNQYVFDTEENKERFLSEMTELMNLEWESPEHLTIEELGSITITPATLLGLGDLFIDKGDME